MMSIGDWRDDPSIIWQDEDDARLRVGPWNGFFSAECPEHVEDVPISFLGPTTPDEWDELLHRLAAAGGRRITGIEDAPRQWQVGDLVRFGKGMEVTILAVGRRRVFVRGDDGHEFSWEPTNMTLVKAVEDES